MNLGTVSAAPSGPGQRSGMSAKGWVVLGLLAATAFVVLCVLVAMRTTQQVDVDARGLLRPNDVWGSTQIRADLVVEGLKPRNLAFALALFGVVTSLRRRTWRPAWYAGLLLGIAGTVTMATKLLLQRPDPHHEMSSAGSFPSGHTVAVLVCLGASVLILRERSRWWEWAVVLLAGLGMGLALLIQATHWLTDVIGGSLLALAVLAMGSVSSLRRSARGSS